MSDSMHNEGRGEKVSHQMEALRQAQQSQMEMAFWLGLALGLLSAGALVFTWWASHIGF